MLNTALARLADTECAEIDYRCIQFFFESWGSPVL